MWSARKIAIVTRTIAKHAYPTNVNPNAKPDKLASTEVAAKMIKSVVQFVVQKISFVAIMPAE